MKESVMKKLLSLLILLALAVGLCSGYALAAEGGGELYIDWAPESLGDDPNAPEYSNVYTEPTGPSEEEYAAAREALLLMLEEEGIASDEIDLDAYLAEMMPMTVAEGEVPTTFTAPTPNESGATAASSHYYTAAAYNVAISNQGSDPICWAVAAMDCLKIGAEIDKLSGLNLSSEPLVHYAYAGFTDKHNSQLDYISPTTRYGNVYASLMTLASGAGTGTTLDKTQTTINYANNQLWLKNGHWFCLSGSKDRNAVKQAIVENGAVALSLYLDSTLTGEGSIHYNSATKAYRYAGGDPKTTNHEVVIVGWDDDYSAANFVTPPTNDKGEALNGAWLCRNSWSSTWGEDGYFWLSYYDDCLLSRSMAVSFDAERWNSDLNLYQYDCNYSLYCTERVTGSTVTIANVYTADASEKLTAVGTYAAANGMSYKVEIYTGLTDAAKPDSGTRKAEESGQFAYSGYQTHTLSASIYLKQGEKFAVVYTFTFPSTSSNNWLPICTNYTSSDLSLTAYNSANAGESFLLSDSSWIDRSKNDTVNYRIKAFTLPHTHSWDSGVEQKPASCTVDGTTLYTCTACGDTKTEPIAAGHALVHTEAKAAEATVAGNKEYWKCSICGLYFSDAAGKTEIQQSDTVMPPLHKLSHIEAKAATATKPGNTEHWKCSDCGQCFSDAEGKNSIDESTTVIAAKGFSDVKESAYYHDKVVWAVENDIVKGATDDTFDPSGDCTRAQIVAFLWRAAGRPEPKSTSCPFTDVKASAYYYKAVLWAAENSIVKGTTDSTFSPNEKCTRAQVVSFLWRAKGRPEPSGASCPFTDMKTSDYYYKAVLWAAKNSIVAGATTNTFAPDGTCTRAQAVTFLYRAYK